MNQAKADSPDLLYERGLVPLIIGITGHRDLVPSELPRIRRAVRTFLDDLSIRFPDRRIQVLSPLAEGADRLVADVALKMGLELVVVLPMPEDIYLSDFESSESRAEFERLCAAADAVHELPFAADTSLEDIRAYGESRNYHYAQLGVFLCAHSHILLALWDGKPSTELGGTAHVVEFHLDDVMHGYAPTEQLNQQVLADDESDLVYHIVVSRDRHEGQPAAGLEAATGSWLTKNESAPRQPDLDDTYVQIFERTSLFNREARLYRDRIETQAWPLLDDEAAAHVPPVTRVIDRLFRAADWLAIFYQRKRLRVLKVTHSFAFVMGLMFMFYSDFESRRLFIYAFFVCFIIASAFHLYSARHGWNSKYLEYRTLAEGLRVQFYWAAAGVTTEMVSKFSHENFLQKQDLELGWIRNVMRVGGIGCDIAPNPDPAGLEFTVRKWVGDEKSGGQLKYYRNKTDQNRRRTKRLQLLANVATILVAVVLIALLLVASDEARTRLFLLLGSTLLLLGVRQSYANQVAEKDVIRQYDFMYSIFSNAYRKIQTAQNDTDRRRLLRVLGEASLDEHAQWILLHRERPANASDMLRMES